MISPELLLHDFITLWVVIDPIGTLPVFLAVTYGLSAKARRRVALRAVVAAFTVLIGFILIGQLVLEGLGIALTSFQLAGGIVLFIFALTMIFGQGKPQSELEETPSLSQTAIFPLAIPSLGFFLGNLTRSFCGRRGDRGRRRGGSDGRADGEGGRFRWHRG